MMTNDAMLSYIVQTPSCVKISAELDWQIHLFETIVFSHFNFKINNS